MCCTDSVVFYLIVFYLSFLAFYKTVILKNAIHFKFLVQKENK